MRVVEAAVAVAKRAVMPSSFELLRLPEFEATSLRLRGIFAASLLPPVRLVKLHVKSGKPPYEWLVTESVPKMRGLKFLSIPCGPMLYRKVGRL